MSSRIGINNALKQYFGTCQAQSNEPVETSAQLLRKNRSLVAKLRSISDASSWIDEKKGIGAKNIGWGEAARGWQPIKPYSHIPTAIVKKLTKEVYQQTERPGFEPLPVQLHWKDIIKYTSDVTKPHLLPISFDSKKNKKSPRIDLKDIEKSKVRKDFRFQDHENSLSLTSRKLQQNLTRELNLQKENEYKKRPKITLDKQSLEKADRLAKLLRKLPRINQQSKQEVRKLKSPTKTQPKPTAQINIEYESPISTSKKVLPSIPSDISKNKDKPSGKKKRVPAFSGGPSNGEIAVKALELKTQMCLHVVLPSIESKPSQPDTQLEYKSFETQQTKLTRETDVKENHRCLPTSSTKNKDLEDFTSLSKKVSDENYFHWKFLPFLPPVLKQEDKTTQKWKGKRKPASNIVAITQGAAKAGVSSNSINKLQRISVSDVNQTKSLPLTAFAVNSHA